MALTTRKKNIIIADWKTGAFSLNSLAKKHKIAVNTAKNICKDLEHENAHLVDILHNAEIAKKCTKNAQELKAVENIVNDRLKVHNVSSKLLDLVETKIDKNIKFEKVNAGMGVQNLEPTELESSDFKNIADAIYKAGQTLGVVQNSPEVAIQNNQNNTPQININIADE